jgi:hypothetical protein
MNARGFVAANRFFEVSAWIEERNQLIRWRRGFFRVWVVLSVLWIGFVIVLTLQTFLPEPTPPAKGDSAVQRAITPPLALGAIGFAFTWIIRGFRRR